MTYLSHPLILVLATAAITLMAFLLSPRRSTVDGFFGGQDEAGAAPRLWTLVFSQVTTWIFARSLMNAAVLGFYYGFAGALAYAAYYASFLTGAAIVARLRAGRATSVQDWLRGRFGRIGVGAYNAVIGLRLMSEVFANLLVVGVIFSAAYGGSDRAGDIAMILLAIAGLGYAMMGGLRASLRTDVAQMIVFLGVFSIALVALFTLPDLSVSALFTAQGTAGDGPGWVLLIVALLQVISYPAHDPVMMDRGFIADRRTTTRSFLHAFWISFACILGFGLFGIQAGLMAAEGEAMQAVWQRMFGPAILLCINLSLIVSAVSTLDSALASAARLSIVEMGLGKRTVMAGRTAMAVFMLGGVLFLLTDTTDLYAAVAVSGTASMFLAPVLVVGLFADRAIPLWSYLTSFAAAITGAVAYFFQSSPLVMQIFGTGHKYERLMWICILVLIIGFAATLIGTATQRRVAAT